MNKKLLKDYVLDDTTTSRNALEGVMGAFPDSEGVQALLGKSISNGMKMNQNYLSMVSIYGLMEEIDKLKDEIKELK